MFDFMSRAQIIVHELNIQTIMQLENEKVKHGEKRKRKRRGNKAMWTYIHSRLIPTREKGLVI